MFNAQQVASLYGVLSLDASGFTGGLAGADKLADSFGQKLETFGQGVTKLGTSLTLLTAPITAFLGTALKAASDEQTALTQLDAVLKSTGAAAGVTHQEAVGLSDGLAHVTRFSNEAVLGAENLLLTFTSIGDNIFPDATKATLDMSQALGQDLKSSAIQLGKALNEPVIGVTALRRVGVQFTKAQEDMIKSLVNSNDLLGAQTIILKEVQKEFGGSAEAAGTTFAGKLDILNHRVEELQQKIGTLLMNALAPLMDTIGNVVDSVTAWADKNPQLTTTIVLIAGALAVLGPVLIIVGEAIRAIGVISTVVGGILDSTLFLPIMVVVGALALLKRAYDTDFLGFKETVDNAVAAIGSALQLIPFYASYYLGKIWTQVQPLLQPLLDWFNGTGTDSFGGAVTMAYTTIIKPAIDNITKLLGGIWAAVSPALTTLYNWFVTDGLPFITSVIQSAMDNFIQPLIDTVSGIWSVIQPALQSMFDWFVTSGLPEIGSQINDVLHNFVLPFINTLIGLWTKVGPPLTDFMNGIKSILGWIVDNVLTPFAQGVQSIIDTINRLRGITAPSNAHPGTRGGGDPGNVNSWQAQMSNPALVTPPGLIETLGAWSPFNMFRAGGGPVSAGSSYVVGERGPELFTPSRSGTITPNSPLGGRTVNGGIHLHFPDIRELTPDQVEHVAARVLEVLMTP